MVQENGEYTTIDNLLDGYKGKVYGDAGEYPYSCTMSKIIVQNGKVISATGELGYNLIKDFGENNDENEQISETSNEIYSGENSNKLPRAGEKTNVFAKWLSIAIFLGIFWLGSMLLIDREKNKMTKK